MMSYVVCDMHDEEKIIGTILSSAPMHIGERICWFKGSAWRVKDVAHRIDRDEVSCVFLVCRKEK
jgi:hypothetical protein